ncbi:MAG: TAP-like protein [Actinomycetota bacterium]|nr:TAP-like protein [Actinomycetota bacterium]
MLQGDLDYTTPLRAARRAASHLKHAQLVVFPGRAHTVYALQPDDSCVLALRNAFLDDPLRRLDTSCDRTTVRSATRTRNSREQRPDLRQFQNAPPAGFEPAAHGLGNRCSIP